MIDMLLDELQTELFAVARSAASDCTGQSATEVGDGWSTLGDVGVFGVGLAESAGGADCGARAEVLVGEAFGRELAPVSVIGPIIAAHLLAAVGGHDDLLGRVVSGADRVAVAVPNGEQLVVADLDGATYLVAVDGDSVSLSATESLSGVTPQRSVDRGVTLSSVAHGSVVASAALPELAGRFRLIVAAMAAGVAAATVERAVEYAKDRHQYGKPIGSFQAVKHRCVDMAVRSEAATSLVRLTAMRLDAGEFDAAAVHASVAVASEAARENAASCVQVLGGIGFTVEGGVDVFLHRAWTLDLLAGGSFANLDALVQGRLAGASH